ncbi:MAG: helix-turn-helix transcriptional regulator [Pseudomonadota bacterium]|nr:helix-turn-helix transcriptional regulator [Pseudomonadota bacterium]
MSTNSTSALETLPAFLRRCRERLDPAAFGLGGGKRRTPGLRREEVAQRANASVTWYTWLEQGREGTPSADMLDRLSRALALSADEREHLFLLAQHRPPSVGRATGQPSMGKLQGVLDSLSGAAAFIKNHRWDVLAWNEPALAVLTDYTALPLDQRNILEILFCRSEPRARLPMWEVDARAAIAAFRRDVARVGAGGEVQPLISSLMGRSECFRRFWDEGIVATLAEGRKIAVLPGIGRINLDYSAFGVEGAPHLSMVVYTPVSDSDRALLEAAVAAHRSAR